MDSRDPTDDREREFSDYFGARSTAMRRTAFLLCGDWHRAEDITQAAFVKLYLRWHRVSRREVLDSYTRRIILRTFLNERRIGWFRHTRTTDALPEVPAGVDPADERVVLVRALASVPPRQRAVLVLRYWEDCSVEETAELLHISVGTVKSQASRGLVHLRALVPGLQHTD